MMHEWINNQLLGELELSHQIGESGLGVTHIPLWGMEAGHSDPGHKVPVVQRVKGEAQEAEDTFLMTNSEGQY
jgi:hypothetical protein